jgi:pyruvate/2-oxoglutarate dehydrogenase complex dihydrolipoamide acyltransferase (E2) component
MTNFSLVPYPRERDIVVDSGYLAVKRHIIYGLAEVDVTLPCQLLQESHGGAPLSFTAFIVASLGRAIMEFPQVQAYRDWRGRLVLFHEVDVATLIEPEPGAVAFPHVIRNAHLRTVAEISNEIHKVKAAPHLSPQRLPLAKIARLTPRFARLLYLRLLMKNPQRFKQVAGTTSVTSVGMFVQGRFWGIAFLPMHTLGLTVGGIAAKPGVHEGVIAIREYLDLTIAFNHDVVDGAPAARFGNALAEMIASAAVLKDSAE